MRLQRDGGEVRSEGLGFPDLLMSAMLAGTLSLFAIAAFAQSKTAKPVAGTEQLVPGIIFLLALAGGVVAFLVIRKVPLAGVFRPIRVAPWRAIGRGGLLLLAALPIVGLFSLIALLLPQDMQQEQELVTLFGDVSKSGNLETIVLIVLAAVVVAPLCEEFVFRGYFYPVWKRYFGPVGSAVLASTLFALMHVNIASLPGLFALAMCFTVAFEISGSILVPITMHAIFNSLSLVMLYLRAQGMV